MKIKLTRQDLLKAIEYHATEGYGLTPVVESDEDVTDWTRYLLTRLTGYDDSELAGAGFGLVFDGDAVTLAGDAGIIEAARESIP